MQYDTVASADAAVSMTGDVWTACVPPELDFGGSLSGPSALSARDEAFEYTTTQPQTAEAEAFYREVKIARQGRVVVVIDLFVDGAPPAEAYLSQSIATRALERATDASRVASATTTPDPGWLRSRDLPTRPGTQWADGVVTSRRSDLGFTACDQDRLPSANGVTRQDEKSFGDEGAIANQAQFSFDSEASARAYLTSFARLYDECGVAQQADLTVRALASQGMTSPHGTTSSVPVTRAPACRSTTASPARAPS